MINAVTYIIYCANKLKLSTYLTHFFYWLCIILKNNLFSKIILILKILRRPLGKSRGSQQIYLLRRGAACHYNPTSQLAFTCLKLAKETLEQGVKYVQS